MPPAVSAEELLELVFADPAAAWLEDTEGSVSCCFNLLALVLPSFSVPWLLAGEAWVTAEDSP